MAEARRRADVVVVSVHSHEPGESRRDPAEFLRAFAHRMIDEGADAVAGHGPHFLRGVELYRGRPIFYSLGNVVSQLELSDHVPAEDYARLPLPGPVTPGRYFDEFGGHGRRLFAPHREYWQSVVPLLTFLDGDLVDVRLHPVSSASANRCTAAAAPAWPTGARPRRSPPTWPASPSRTPPPSRCRTPARASCCSTGREIRPPPGSDPHSAQGHTKQYSWCPASCRRLAKSCHSWSIV